MSETDPFWPGPGLRETAMPTPAKRDVVDKLAELDRAAKKQGEKHGFIPTPMFGIAADEIMSSRAEIARLREALAPFAKAANCFDDSRLYQGEWGAWENDETVDDTEVAFSVGDLRRARSAHEGKT